MTKCLSAHLEPREGISCILYTPTISFIPIIQKLVQFTGSVGLRFLCTNRSFLSDLLSGVSLSEVTKQKLHNTKPLGFGAKARLRVVKCWMLQTTGRYKSYTLICLLACDTSLLVIDVSLPATHSWGANCCVRKLACSSAKKSQNEESFFAVYVLYSLDEVARYRVEDTTRICDNCYGLWTWTHAAGAPIHMLFSFFSGIILYKNKTSFHITHFGQWQE